MPEKSCYTPGCSIALWLVINWTLTWIYIFTVRNVVDLTTSQNVFELVIVYPYAWIIVTFIVGIKIVYPDVFDWRDVILKSAVLLFTMILVSVAALHFTLVTIDDVVISSDAYINFNSLWVIISLWTTALGTIFGTYILSAFYLF